MEMMKIQLIATQNEAWLGPTGNVWIRVPNAIVVNDKLADVRIDDDVLHVRSALSIPTWAVHAQYSIISATQRGVPDGEMVAISKGNHIWYKQDYHDRYPWLVNFVGDRAGPAAAYTPLPPHGLRSLSESEIVRIRLTNNIAAFAMLLPKATLQIDTEKSWQRYCQHVDIEMYRYLTESSTDDVELLLFGVDGEQSSPPWVDVVSATTTHWMLPQRQAAINTERLTKVAREVFDTLDWVRVGWSPKS